MERNATGFFHFMLSNKSTQVIVEAVTKLMTGLQGLVT